MSAPAPGVAVEAAPGVLWSRLPMPFMMGHVNVYALDDGDGWTLIDAGVATDDSRAAWRSLLDGPLAQKPVRRLIVTHHHPDHIGLAGWLLRETGARLWCARLTWHHGMSLQRDAAPMPAETERFHIGAGYDPAMAETWRVRARHGFNRAMEPLPYGFQAILPGETLEIGGRFWRAAFAQGHAPDHLLLISDDGALMIGGDAILPENPAPLSVYSTEPWADPVSEFFAWAESALPGLPESALVLPGHDVPFRNPRAGLQIIIDRDRGRSEKLLAAFRSGEAKDARAVDVFSHLFRRPITAGLFGLAVTQAMAHLNHLERRGLIVRRTDAAGAWRFSAA